MSIPLGVNPVPFPWMALAFVILIGVVGVQHYSAKANSERQKATIAKTAQERDQAILALNRLQALADARNAALTQREKDLATAKRTADDYINRYDEIMENSNEICAHQPIPVELDRLLRQAFPDKRAGAGGKPSIGS